MALTFTNSKTMYLPETPTAEPIQIVSKPDVEYVVSTPKKSSIDRRQYQIVWRNVLIFIYLHSACVYGIYQVLFVAKWLTLGWTLFITWCGAMGITAGAHRLWSHKCYKAKLPLRIMLGIFQTIALQNHIYEWCRDHRVHHKFTETDADPHNAARGFFFSHIGWLMLKKHKDVITRGKTVDMSDLEEDSVVVFQRRFYPFYAALCCFIMPTLVPWYFWNEDLYTSWYATITRYVLSLNGTWCVNSAAHIWGSRPYDKFIAPTENRFVAAVAMGEGWHNYHHIFPWDYKAAELGNYRLNFTTAFIDLMAKIGWAYNLKTASPQIVEKRKLRTGCDSKTYTHSPKNDIWGWGDKDMNSDEMKEVKEFNKATD